MRKSILIGVLALLMVFAFTSCEQQAYKVPVGLTASTTKAEYLVGEALDPNTVTITIDYSDGSSRNVSGTQFGLNSTQLTTAGMNSIPVSYETLGSTGSSNTLSASVDVMVYSIEKAEVSNLPTTGTFKNSDVTIDDSAVSVVVTYNNGQSTRTLSGDDISLEATVTSPKAGMNEAKANLSIFKTAVTAPVTTNPEKWEITLTEEKTPAGTYDPDDYAKTIVKLTYVDNKDGLEKFVETSDGWTTVLPSTTGDYYFINDVISYEVLLVDSEGNEAAATKGTDFWFVGGEPASADIKLGKDNLGKTTQYTIVTKGNQQMTFTIPVATDYVVSVDSVERGSSLSAETGTATAAHFDFNVTMASAEGKEIAGSAAAPSTITPGANYIYAEVIDNTVNKESFATYSPRVVVSYGKPVYNSTDSAWEFNTSVERNALVPTQG